MKWTKAPEELVRLLDEAMKGLDCERKPMFGYPAYFINKNMFTGLFQDQLFVRLSAEQLSALRVKFPAIANLEPMTGRPMKDYFVLPKTLQKDPRALRSIIEKAAEYTSTLTPKSTKAKKTGQSRKK